MDLTGIISISGKPGLYNVVAQSNNSLIVENVETGRRMPAFATNKISALQDITMYTIEEDMPLPEIMQNIYEKQEGKEAPNHKEDISVLRDFATEVIPNCDHERIYDSDIRKLVQWYNVLQSSGLLEKKIAEAKEAEKADKKEKKKEKKSEESAES